MHLIKICHKNPHAMGGGCWVWVGKQKFRDFISIFPFFFPQHLHVCVCSFLGASEILISSACISQSESGDSRTKNQIERAPGVFNLNANACGVLFVSSLSRDNSSSSRSSSNTYSSNIHSNSSSSNSNSGEIATQKAN